MAELTAAGHGSFSGGGSGGSNGADGNYSDALVYLFLGGGGGAGGGLGGSYGGKGGGSINTYGATSPSFSGNVDYFYNWSVGNCAGGNNFNSQSPTYGSATDTLIYYGFGGGGAGGGGGGDDVFSGLSVQNTGNGGAGGGCVILRATQSLRNFS